MKMCLTSFPHIYSLNDWLFAVVDETKPSSFGWVENFQENTLIFDDHFVFMRSHETSQSRVP